ncbi:MAG: HU family DNA-binding protein [Nocardioides sp.]|jgi:DNA-binding protein HU-beta
MDKTQLIDALAERFDGDRVAAERALDAVLDTVTQRIARGEKVSIDGFGSWRKRTRPARNVRHPQSGKAVKLPARSGVLFKADGALKKAVRQGD